MTDRLRSSILYQQQTEDMLFIKMAGNLVVIIVMHFCKLTPEVQLQMQKQRPRHTQNNLLFVKKKKRIKGKNPIHKHTLFILGKANP